MRELEKLDYSLLKFLVAREIRRTERLNLPESVLPDRFQEIYEILGAKRQELVDAG